jgi:IS1 family transposase
MNRLSLKDRAQIIGLLVEGNSLRSITRITGKSINTVTKLVVDVGYAASIYQHEVMRNLPCKLIQCDEIWSFCYAKERNVAPGNKNLGHGDVWTWTAICADTKLVPSFFVGNHSAEDAQLFIRDLESRLANRVQLTTDGLQTYLSAVQSAFGSEVDYAQLQKTYGSPERTTERRYSPMVCTGAYKERHIGNPDMDKVSTSYVERQNLTMRMGMRRFTRLTNGFSKKIENHILSVALHFMHYNFGRIHKTLRVTPAMQAGISDHVWSLEEIAKLAD